MSGRLLLIRHGEPVDHTGRCVGHYDIDLSPSATQPLLRLAAGAMGMTTPPRVVVASDLRRAARSAAILARAWNAELRFDPRLREVSFGNWEGRLWSDIARDDASAMEAWGSDWTRFSAPGGETGAAFAMRARAALNDLVTLAATEGDVAVVTHAGWIRVATTILLREPLASAFDRTIDYARAAIVDLDPTNVRLIDWNVDALDAPSAMNASALPPTQP